MEGREKEEKQKIGRRETVDRGKERKQKRTVDSGKKQKRKRKETVDSWKERKQKRERRETDDGGKE